MKNALMLLGILTAILISLLFSNSAMAEKPVHYSLNGKPVMIDTQPYIINGKMYLPVKDICKALGSRVIYNEENDIIGIELKDINTAYGQELDPRIIRDEKTPDIVMAYALVIEEIYKTDIGLNEGINEIALDLNGVTNLVPREKKDLIKLLNKKGWHVIDKGYDELIKYKYVTFMDTEEPLGVFKQGILITINDQPMINDTVTVTCDKYRSAYGAVGYGPMVIKYLDGNWVVSFYKENAQKGQSARPLILADKIKTKQSVPFYFNGKPVKIEIEPLMVNGRMYLPVRDFFEGLGGEVTWDSQNRIVDFGLKRIATYRSKEGPYSIPCKKTVNLVEAYAIVVDELYNYGNGPYEGTRYIAIDTTGISNLSYMQKVELLNSVQRKYQLVIVDKTKDQLITEGYAKKRYYEGRPYWEYENGVLIEIKNKPIENNTIKVSAFIQHSDSDFEGFSDLTIQYYDGYWVIKHSGRWYS